MVSYRKPKLRSNGKRKNIRGVRRYWEGDSGIMARSFMINPIALSGSMPSPNDGGFRATPGPKQGEPHAKRVRVTHPDDAGIAAQPTSLFLG
jgi:hypothetical protein